MEWYGTENKNCLCGKGIHQIEKYSDDWNQYKTKWVMICPLCKANYVLWSYETYEKGNVYINYLWFSKELEQKAKRNENI